MSRNDGHRAGELSEFAVAADLVDKGCRVSHTHGEYKYDLVADWDGCLLRVQVKKANQDTEKPWKYRIFTDRYEAGDVDLFAGHLVDEDEVFYATFEDGGSNEFRINSKTSAEIEEYNSHAKLVEDYTFGRAISRLCDDQ
ncbi:group I intron-associated PD-(D/E)XK endonuclease [Haloplanus halobius]|uniref:group I intron-associated PD-(D/E)XK endonuclease n=1 Tax=Haloplanus halobius TaxID=2934938 RepID=UPI003CE51ACC